MAQMMTTDHRPTGKPCRRCKGTGAWPHYAPRGICYGCGGDGREREEYQRPMTAEEIAKYERYRAGIEACERREAERKARRAARAAAGA